MVGGLFPLIHFVFWKKVFLSFSNCFAALLGMASAVIVTNQQELECESTYVERASSEITYVYKSAFKTLNLYIVSRKYGVPKGI